LPQSIPATQKHSSAIASKRTSTVTAQPKRRPELVEGPPLKRRRFWLPLDKLGVTVVT
jgi:hypothetical protein